MNKIRRFPLSLNAGFPVYGLGLLTDEPDYRLCWLINQNFPWLLVRSDDIEITDKNRPIPQLYACFESRETHHAGIRLIGNRSKEGAWMTVFRQVDYLLAFPISDPSGYNLDELKGFMGSCIPQIRGSFKIPLPSFCYL